MNDATTAHAEHHLHDGSEDFTHELLYVKVAIGLAILTVFEVAWPYLFEDAGFLFMGPLLLMMAVKFVIIASFFMHLRFDSKLLSQIFYAGLLLAVSVYVIALVTLHVFSNG